MPRSPIWSIHGNGHFPAKILYEFLVSTMHSKYSNHLILYLITLTILHSSGSE